METFAFLELARCYECAVRHSEIESNDGSYPDQYLFVADNFEITLSGRSQPTNTAYPARPSSPSPVWWGIA
ncbi:MAG TPA: hypothetical protein ACFE0H_15845 [Elainellaceae cyanobacterium]